LDPGERIMESSKIINLDGVWFDVDKLKEQLLAALQTEEFEVTPEELESRNLGDLLREKTAEIELRRIKG
jgi:hypothetical protein